jgi:ArsR family transcriptional regulator
MDIATSFTDEAVNARRFGALGDPVRLAILRELENGPACGCDLAPELGIAPNLLSYHLQVLRDAGLLERTRHGRRTEYRIRPKGLEELTVELVRLVAGNR